MNADTAAHVEKPAGASTSLWTLLSGVDGTAPEGWTRTLPPNAFVTDAIIGVVTTLLTLVSYWSTAASGIYEGTAFADSPLWLVIALPAAMGVTTALRRRFPISTLFVATAIFVTSTVLYFGEVFISQIFYFFMIFTAGGWSSKRTLVTWLRILISVGMIFWAMSAALLQSAFSPEGFQSAAAAYSIFTTLVNLVYFAGALWFGNIDYRRAGQEAAYNERAAQLESQRRQLAEQAVRLDRLRIARELHDAVAHHVSLMGLQSAAARRVLDKSPEKAEAALRGIETSARSAIDELQSMLTTLRDEGMDAQDLAAAEGYASAVPGPDTVLGPRSGDAAGFDEAASPLGSSDPTAAPSTHTVERIPALIDEVRAVGMNVTYHVIGNPVPLTPATHLTVYRTLQEALTNVRKHAPAGAGVDVRLRYRSGAVELDVTNDGHVLAGSAAAGAGAGAATAGAASALAAAAGAIAGTAGAGHAEGARGGRGIVGMRERAAAVGGTLVAGPRAEGGFRVLLTIPLSGHNASPALTSVDTDATSHNDYEATT